MKWIVSSIAAFLFLLTINVALPQTGTHKHTAVHASKACRNTLADCPRKGCGGGDLLLNAKKNRLDPPSTPLQSMTFMDFLHLEEERPSHWIQNQARDEVEQLGEDTPVMLAGFLLGAHEGSPETCNCKLSGEANNDYHINIVERSGDRMRDSVVVEMTPKMRASIPEWTLPRINGLVTNPVNPPLVRVSGYLLFDSEHVSRSGGERATIWEIHPVTKFEVCPAGNCTVDATAGWNDIRTIP